MSSHEHPITIVLSNEFATVHLVIDDLANGPRLVVFDPSSGRSIALDPLELQTLAWARHEDLERFMTPAYKEQYLDRISPNRGEAPVPSPPEEM